MSWLSKIKEGLSKTSKLISSGISDIFSDNSITPQKLEELE
jgi:hypothetical protein